jgi:hypothetical protein
MKRAVSAAASEARCRSPASASHKRVSTVSNMGQHQRGQSSRFESPNGLEIPGGLAPRGPLPPSFAGTLAAANFGETSP